MVDTSECNMPKSDADRANVIATRYIGRFVASLKRAAT
jgi:hypothetical protein